MNYLKQSFKKESKSITVLCVLTLHLRIINGQTFVRKQVPCAKREVELFILIFPKTPGCPIADRVERERERLLSVTFKHLSKDSEYGETQVKRGQS